MKINLSIPTSRLQPHLRNMITFQLLALHPEVSHKLFLTEVTVYMSRVMQACMARAGGFTSHTFVAKTTLWTFIVQPVKLHHGLVDS